MSSSTSSPEAEAETRFMESLNGEEREEGGEGESKPLITGEVDHENEGSEEEQVQSTAEKVAKWRNIAAFWLFGLCNNFPYVIMLSAAFDILSDLQDNNEGSSNSDNSDEFGAVFGTGNSSDDSPGACRAVFNSSTNTSHFKTRYCNTAGTSVILLADIVPTFIIKLTLPYVMNFVPYWIRIFASALFSALSFVLVGVSTSVTVVIVGVACASISSGIGEITFLSFTAHYDKSTISGWGSGTGAAGIGGALVYAGLKTFLSAKVTMLLQLVVPVVLILAYLFLLTKPAKLLPSTPAAEGQDSSSGRRIKLKLINREEARYFVSHIKHLPHLVKYMVPLYLVYISEYLINQGLFELLYYENTHLGATCLDQQDQYRWYQVVYQLGVFISRSSLFLVYIKWFWILSILQVINFVLFFLEAIYLVLPSYWITFFLVLYEGLLGGGVYVNTFYTITKQVPLVHREFSMGAASVADSFGITSAGIASIFIHNFICSNYVHGD